MDGEQQADLQSAIQKAILNAFSNGLPASSSSPGVTPGFLQIQESMQSWQAPYPPPEAVERYERILPGTFNLARRRSRTPDPDPLYLPSSSRPTPHDDDREDRASRRPCFDPALRPCIGST
jgi:hypothetical protein